MNIYEQCPETESEHYRLRLTIPDDLEDLLKIYSDRFALPFFNSDNCHGDKTSVIRSDKLRLLARICDCPIILPV